MTKPAWEGCAGAGGDFDSIPNYFAHPVTRPETSKVTLGNIPPGTPIYISVEKGGALYFGEEEKQYRLSLLSKTEPYPYGTRVEVDVGGDWNGQPQWVPFRAINHFTDKFDQLWIKVDLGQDDQPSQKFFVRSQFVRKLERPVVPLPEGYDQETWLPVEGPATHFPERD